MGNKTNTVTDSFKSKGPTEYLKRGEMFFFPQKNIQPSLAKPQPVSLLLKVPLIAAVYGVFLAEGH